MLGCLPKQRMLTIRRGSATGDSRIHPAWIWLPASWNMEIRGVGNLLGAEQSGQMEQLALTFKNARRITP